MSEFSNDMLSLSLSIVYFINRQYGLLVGYVKFR